MSNRLWRVLLAGAMVTILTGHAQADRLPLRDGLYTTDASYCGFGIEERLDRFGDSVALHMRRITGNEIDYLYEGACWARNSRLDGNQLVMTKICNSEGETWEEVIRWRFISSEAFEDDGRIFEHCRSTSPTSNNE